MSEVDVSCLLNTHLKHRFLNLLQRIKDGNPTKLPLFSRFNSIETDILCSHTIWFDIKSVESLSDVLQTLIDALLECRTFSYQHEVFLVHRLVLLLFSRKMEARINIIENRLRSARIDPNSRAASANKNGEFMLESTPDIAQDIIGFDAIAKQIEDKLLPGGEVDKQQFKAIAIVGSGGSGKSTLAQKLFNSMKEKYDIHIWVSLSGISLWEHNVVKCMLEKVKSDALTSVFDILGMLTELKEGLKGKSYLIVLDNLQVMKDWYNNLKADGETSENKLSHALPKGSGGTVIVTTRLEKGAEKIVGSEHVIRLDSGHSAHDVICWSILKRNLHNGRNASDTIVEEMRTDIIENCSGIPLAAKALANIINCQKKEFYRRVH